MAHSTQPEQGMLNGASVDTSDVLQQASGAMDRAMMENEGNWILPSREEPTDHEAEGAMLYVMSRGRR